MAMQFIQEPNAPRGMGRVVDEATGLDRVVYDPALADQAEAAGAIAPTPAQQSVIENAPAPTAAPVADPNAPRIPGEAPRITEQQAQAWQSAQAPAPAPTVRASGNPPPPAPAPAGTVLSKAKVEMGEPGYTYDKVAEEQRGEALLDRTLELQRRADAMDVVRNEQQLELEKQRDEAKRREAENAQKSTRYERELETTVKREINQDRLEENKGLFGSILGLVGQTLGYLSTPDSGFGRLQAALERRTLRDIEAQKEVKTSTINRLTAQLGNAQQAENHYRAQVYSTTANILETKLQRLGVADQYADKIQGLRDNALAYNEAAKAASFGKPGQAEYEYERPKPTGEGKLPLTATEQELKSVGVTRKQWTDGLQGKVRAGENSPTVAMAVDEIKNIDADVNLLESLAAENGGTIPTTGIVRIPQSLVGLASRAGISQGMEAEKVRQLLDEYINKKARQYGGAITDSDRESAMKEFGSSTEGNLFALKRMRERTNGAVRSALPAHFPGSEQAVLDILLRQSGQTKGVPENNPKPAVRTDPPKAAAAPKPELSGDEKRQADNRKKARDRVFDFFGNNAPNITGPRYGAKF